VTLATVSRSPLELLRRLNLSDESLRPAPRLDVSALKVHTVPLASPPMPSQDVLRTFEGDPPPDRTGPAQPWPGQK
jgi:hypothetical protein